jgi:hypothetical protein
VKQNVALADTGSAGSLTKEELDLYGKVKKELEGRVMIPRITATLPGTDSGAIVNTPAQDRNPGTPAYHIDECLI